MLDPLITTLVILVIATILFLSDKLSADLIGMFVAVALGLTGVLSPQETLAGFSRSAVITIIAIFFLAEGLRRTGVTDQVGRWLVRFAGAKEGRLVLLVMLAGAFLSLFMNNIAAAAVLLPAVSVAARRSQVKPSRLLMPLAFSTILGGMATLLTTTNIIASSLLRDENLSGFGLLDFAPLGLPIVLAGLTYMIFIGKRLLPAGLPLPETPEETDLVGVYRLGERLLQAKITASSPLVGLTLSQSRLRESYGLSVVAVEHSGQMILSPSPKLRFASGDVLTLEGRVDQVPWEQLQNSLQVMPPRVWGERDLESSQVAVVEAVLSPRSRLIGQTLKEVNFREKYGMVVLAVWRSGRPIRRDLANLKLEFGDALLLQGPRDRLPVLATEPDVILLNGEDESYKPTRQGSLAVAIMLAALTASIVFPEAIAEILLAGGLSMVAFRLLSMEEAYRAIEWKSVFLVAGMLSMGLAISKTGAGELAAKNMIALMGTGNPVLLLAGLFLVTMLLAQVMHSGAVAAVMVPIAIQVARSLSLEPHSFVMGVTLATSMTFLTPLGHPVNVLVMGPGGYRFRDYFKVGFPLVLLLFLVVMLFLPVIWPFT